MTTKDIYSQSEHHMKRSIETLKENLMKIRTGRAHTGLLEHITVDYYGCPTPISRSLSSVWPTPEQSLFSLGKRKWLPWLKKQSATPIWG